MNSNELEALRPLVARVVRTRLREPQDVADVVQETLLKAWLNWDRCDAGRDPRYRNAWMVRIARNAAADFWDQQRYRFRSGCLPLEEALYVPAALTPEQEVLPWMDGRLSVLSPQDREALRMMGDGYGYTDIAEAQGCPVWAVRKRLHAARQILRPLWDGA